MSKKKRKKVQFNPYREDCHHLLFQGRHWNQGWAKRLREHQYFKVMIPQMTLHREIHSKIHDVPVPNGADCRRAYEAVEKGLREGLLDYRDNIGARLDLLISLWSNCPATCAVLEWQKQVIAKFYNGGLD